MEGVCCGQGSATASRRLTAPLTLQYPGVQVIIVHPDFEPSLIVCEKVVGSAHDHIPLKKDWINQSFFSGADGGSRTLNHLVTNEMLCH